MSLTPQHWCGVYSPLFYQLEVFFDVSYSQRGIIQGSCFAQSYELLLEDAYFYLFPLNSMQSNPWCLFSFGSANFCTRRFCRPPHTLVDVVPMAHGYSLTSHVAEKEKKICTTNYANTIISMTIVIGVICSCFKSVYSKQSWIGIS